MLFYFYARKIFVPSLSHAKKMEWEQSESAPGGRLQRIVVFLWFLPTSLTMLKLLQDQNIDRLELTT
jgi:hypothetical protein